MSMCEEMPYKGSPLELMDKLRAEVRVAREERDRLNSHLLDAKELIQRMMKQEATNAELLRLLERHHKESIAENRLHPADDLLYSDTELCRETEAAIEHAKEKV